MPLCPDLFVASFGRLKGVFVSMLRLQVVIYITMLLFAFKVYTSGLFPIGSIENMWNNLNRMAQDDAVPVAGMRRNSPLKID